MKLASCRCIIFRKDFKESEKDSALCFLHKDLATNNLPSSTDYGNYFFNGKWKPNFSKFIIVHLYSRLYVLKFHLQ